MLAKPCRKCGCGIAVPSRDEKDEKDAALSNSLYGAAWMALTHYTHSLTSSIYQSKKRATSCTFILATFIRLSKIVTT
eukprot:COSAG02_NODE_298_length_25350_cov_48.266999_1_plen_78_part_00